MDALPASSTSMGAIIITHPSGLSSQKEVLWVPLTMAHSTGTSRDEDMTQIADILNRLGNVENKVGSVSNDMATVKERIQHMPTNTRMYILAGSFLLSVMGALAWIVSKYLEPILSASK